MDDYKVKYLDQIATLNPVKKELKGLPGLGKFAQWCLKLVLRFATDHHKNNI